MGFSGPLGSKAHRRVEDLVDMSFDRIMDYGSPVWVKCRTITDEHFAINRRTGEIIRESPLMYGHWSSCVKMAVNNC